MSVKISVRLLLRHPQWPPADITTALGLQPAVAACVGDDVVTPAGIHTGHRHRHTQWTYCYEDEALNSDRYNEGLLRLAYQLSQSEDYLREFVASGGYCDLILRVPTLPRSYGLKSDFLAKVASLGFDLGIELQD